MVSAVVVGTSSRISKHGQICVLGEIYVNPSRRYSIIAGVVFIVDSERIVFRALCVGHIQMAKLIVRKQTRELLNQSRDIPLAAACNDSELTVFVKDRLRGAMRLGLHSHLEVVVDSSEW